MATPIAVFPGAVATDENLKVANNRIQTTLRTAITASDMVIPVASTAGFRPNSVTAIGQEIVAVEGVQDAPCPALLVAGSGRGFDGTAAVPHTAGARVLGNIVAWHHNTLSAEIQAIEQFLLGGGLLGPGFIFNQTYNFPAQTPGISLTPGSNTITLRPVPRGVNGSDRTHSLYISGGSGTPETVYITGGTAISGAASGTVTFNCRFAHSGAWRISSATAGIREAVEILGPRGGGTIFINNDVSNVVYGELWILWRNITLMGLSGSLIIAGNTAGIVQMIKTEPNYSTGFRMMHCIVDGNRREGGTSGSGATTCCFAIGASDCQIIGCEIRENNRVGIFIGDTYYTTENVLIDRCHIHDNGGISGHGGTGAGYFGTAVFVGGAAVPNNIRITNNFLIHNHNTDTEPGDSCALNITGTGVICSHNYIEDNFNVNGGQISINVLGTQGGIDDQPPTWQCRSAIIGNIISCSGRWGTPPDQTGGIEVLGREITIVGNVLYNLPQWGTTLEGDGSGVISVVGNSYLHVGNGIWLNPTPTAGPRGMDHITLVGNTIIADNYPIGVDPVHRNIAIRDNTLFSSINQQGISGYFGPNNEVSNNLGYRADAAIIPMTPSPMIYTAGPSPTVISIRGAASLDVYQTSSGYLLGAAAPDWTFTLNPNDSITIYYTGTPTMLAYPLV